MLGGGQYGTDSQWADEDDDGGHGAGAGGHSLDDLAQTVEDDDEGGQAEEEMADCAQSKITDELGNGGKLQTGPRPPPLSQPAEEEEEEAAVEQDDDELEKLENQLSQPEADEEAELEEQ